MNSLWRQIATPTKGSVLVNEWCAKKLAIIRDSIVPDESDRKRFYSTLSKPKRSVQYARWLERRRIRDLLTAEIEKARLGQ